MMDTWIDNSLVIGVTKFKDVSVHNIDTGNNNIPLTVGLCLSRTLICDLYYILDEMKYYIYQQIIF